MQLSLKEVPYSVPPTPWDERLGHHRACVRVEKKAPAVQVLIPWRRRDHDATGKNILVIDATTMKRIRNVVRIHIDRERGVLAFEPQTAPGEYYFYYLPCPVPLRGKYEYPWDYDPPENTADPAWLERCGLAEGSPGAVCKGLPKAKTVRLEARTEFDSFHPMEVIATGEEIKQLLSSYPRPYLLFPEDRKYPIRMTDDLPLRWIKSEPASSFQGEAQLNEFYVFQVGVYAANQTLEVIDVDFSDLRSPAGEIISRSNMRCFNMGGVNWYGRSFRKVVNVPQGTVQALWMGVQIPKDGEPGEYVGKVEIKPRNVEDTMVSLRLTVLSNSLEDHGDGELWRHARLRWLDSNLGVDDEVVGPYTPLEVEGHTVRCMGRQVQIGKDGLLKGIRSGEREILDGSMRLVVETEVGPVMLSGGGVEWTRRAPGAVEWRSSSSGEMLSILTQARMECDGHIHFQLSMKSSGKLKVDDIRLEIPIRGDVATYLMGIGRQGGLRPREYTWRWEGPYDSFWIGEVQAGLHCELRGGSYHGPLIAKYRPAPPPSWWNDGKGGCNIKEDGKGRVLIRVFTGSRKLIPNQDQDFEFALLITPVKPLDTASHFQQRYHHSVHVDKSVLDSGANIINVHHATKVNPYINYPFIAVDRMRDFVRKWHDHRMKVKIYYTVRELSNYAVEIWALRSLGHEVLANGDGGGFTWLREHLASSYTPRWFTLLADGTPDASISVSGASRWYNYYVEGLAWLLKNVEIDGLYLDDVAFDRVTLKRMRKVMDRIRPGSLIDLHSNTDFSIGPANQYAEFFPYIDSIWFGEGFRFNEMSPDNWLVEASGIPFGLMGDILAEHGYSPWQGMIYGMSRRGINPLWKLWDDFGIAESEMIGYWDSDCPVRTDRSDVLTTIYVKNDKALIAVASWSKDQVDVRLIINWTRLGLDPAKVSLSAPPIDDMQEARRLNLSDRIPVDPLGGWLLLLE